MAHLALYLLGPLLVTRAGQPVTAFEYDKVRALLAFLAAEADRPHRREALTGLLWAELPESTARANLRQALAALRRAIGDHAADPPYLLIERAAIQWNPAADSSVDLLALLSLLDESEHHAHRHAAHCRPCAERLGQAVSLYRGAFLAGFSLADSAEFEEWVLLKREWLHHRMLNGLARLVAFHEQRGAYAEAIDAARKELELDPWRESAHRQLMRLLVLKGERRAAMEQYEQCRALLEAELGVEPEAETTRLYEQLLDGAPDAPVERHRLSAPAPRPHNLPPATTPFIGRERELAQLTDLLDSPDTRLVTVVGIGGAGKSRLALQAAAMQLDSFADGVFRVPLAGLDAPERLARAIGETVGLTFSGNAPAESQLLEGLKEKEMLLVLDNFEHLLPAALLPARLLEAAPGLALLVTSRERLRLQGEWLLEPGGLELPAAAATPAEREQSAAVQLFLQGAQRARGAFTPTPADLSAIEGICRALDGLPLGIELAAAWSRLLSFEEIGAEIARDPDFLSTTLRDVPARHRSLEALFNHSWRLLSEVERGVMERLSLFRGGFRREAAEQSAGGGLASAFRPAG